MKCVCVLHLCVSVWVDPDHRDLKRYTAIILGTRHLNEITKIYYLPPSITLCFKGKKQKQQDTIVIITFYQQVIRRKMNKTDKGDEAS